MGIFEKPLNLFPPLDIQQILSDLAESCQQIAEGQGMDMEAALNEMGRRHGFV